MTNEKIKPVPALLVEEMKKYPTADPSKAVPVPVPPQTAKMNAIRRAQLEKKS